MSKSEKKSGFSIVKSAVGEYMKKNYPQLILVFVGLLISVAFAFVRTATSNTVSSFNIDD